MDIIRATVTWWRLVAAAAVLLTGYTVSHYVSAATTPTATPAPTPVVAQATPYIVVVTATPSASSAGAAGAEAQPTALAVTTPGKQARLRESERPSEARRAVATPTPVPIASERVAIVARVPLHPAADGWDQPAGRLAWTLDGASLLAGDGQGIRRLNAPDFQPAALAEAMPGDARDLRLAADGRSVAFVAAGAVWTADLQTGELAPVALGPDGRSRLVRWLPDGRLIAAAGCGVDCEELLALGADGARPLLEFGTQVSPTLPVGASFLFSPSGRLLAFQARGEPHTVVADPTGDWWFLGGWRERERLRAYDQPLGWLDETVLLSYHRSPAGPTVQGHGLDLWQWDVLANRGRFLVADVASASVSPDGSRIALVLLGGPSVDEGGHLVGGRWRPDEPVQAVLAVMDLAHATVLQRSLLGEHPGVPEPAALDGWGALRQPAWSPDGRALLAFDGDRRPLLFDSAAPDAPALRLLEQGGVRDLAWSPDGRYLALRVGDELWVVSLRSS